MRELEQFEQQLGTAQTLVDVGKKMFALQLTVRVGTNVEIRIRLFCRVAEL